MALDSYKGRSMDTGRDPEGIRNAYSNPVNDDWQADIDRINGLLDSIQVGNDEAFKRLVENGIDIETACIRSFGKDPMSVVAETMRELTMIRRMPSIDDKTARRKS